MIAHVPKKQTSNANIACLLPNTGPQPIFYFDRIIDSKRSSSSSSSSSSTLSSSDPFNSFGINIVHRTNANKFKNPKR